LDIANLCCASTLHALYLHLTGTIYPDQYHRQNVENCVYNGINARLRREKKDESVYESLNRWVSELDKYQEMISVNISHLPDKIKGKKLLQRELKINLATRDIEQLRRQGKDFVVAQLNKPRIIRDNYGRRYRIESGTRIEGKIQVSYNLDYVEKDSMILQFTDININNSLKVRGVEIPIDEQDQILVAFNESEYMQRRLFGGFGF
jgi:hypothetical protein